MVLHFPSLERWNSRAEILQVKGNCNRLSCRPMGFSQGQDPGSRNDVRPQLFSALSPQATCVFHCQRMAREGFLSVGGDGWRGPSCDARRSLTQEEPNIPEPERPSCLRERSQTSQALFLSFSLFHHLFRALSPTSPRFGDGYWGFGVWCLGFKSLLSFLGAALPT